MERAVDAGIEVWSWVTTAKRVERAAGVLMNRSMRITNFEAVGEQKIEKLRELLKELVGKEKE